MSCRRPVLAAFLVVLLLVRPAVGQVVSADTPAVGRIESAAGSVSVVRAGGARAALNAGDSVYQGDAVETGDAGIVGIVFLDGSTFSLGQRGRMVIDELVYDPGTRSGSAALRVAQGLFSLISGQIAKSGSQRMAVHTPVIALGIRGTRLAGMVAPPATSSSLFVLLTDPDGGVGEVTLTNRRGAAVVLNRANQGVWVSAREDDPLPEPAPLAERDVRSLLGATLSALPVAPPRPGDAAPVATPPAAMPPVVPPTSAAPRLVPTNFVIGATPRGPTTQGEGGTQRDTARANVQRGRSDGDRDEARRRTPEAGEAGREAREQSREAARDVRDAPRQDREQERSSREAREQDRGGGREAREDRGGREQAREQEHGGGREAKEDRGGREQAGEQERGGGREARQERDERLAEGDGDRGRGNGR